MAKHSLQVPLYHLVTEDSDELVIAAQEMHGFFRDSRDSRSEEVRILGWAREHISLGETLSDVELRVVDFEGNAIGSYYIGRVGLISQIASDACAELSRINATFYGFTCPYVAAGSMWRRWASGIPLRKGEWADYPVEVQDSWLHVVQNSWFETGHSAKRYDDREVCVMDGSKIFGESSFYCALGEAVNGPGGYFGSTLDGLADCLASSWSAGPPFRVVWDSASGAQERMGASLTESVMSVLGEFDIDVSLR